MLMDMTVFLAAVDLNRKKRRIMSDSFCLRKQIRLYWLVLHMQEMAKMNLTQIIFGKQQNRFPYL